MDFKKFVIVYFLVILCFSLSSFIIYFVFLKNVAKPKNEFKFNFVDILKIFFTMFLFSLVLLLVFRTIRKNTKKGKNILKYLLIFIISSTILNIVFGLGITLFFYALYQTEDKRLVNNLAVYILTVLIGALFVDFYNFGYFLSILIGLLIYDVVSVYLTGHMISLAKESMELELPLLFVFKDNAKIGAGDLLISIIYPAHLLAKGNVIGFFISCILISFGGVLGIYVSKRTKKGQAGLLYIVPMVLLSMFIFRS